MQKIYFMVVHKLVQPNEQCGLINEQVQRFQPACIGHRDYQRTDTPTETIVDRHILSHSNTAFCCNELFEKNRP